MKLKLDEKGNVVVQDGKPVYVHDDGKEIPFDAAAALGKISQLNGEAKAHREKAEAATNQLKEFEGLDPAAAKKALEMVKNFDDKKLIDAGEAERVKSEAVKAALEQKTAVEKERDALKDQLYKEHVGRAFSDSQFVKDKLAIPRDAAIAVFGNNAKVEDGKLVIYDSNGQKIYSRTKPGELASLDEGLEMLVNARADKDSWLKGTTASGSGAVGGAGAGPAGIPNSLSECKTEAEKVAYLDAKAKAL